MEIILKEGIIWETTIPYSQQSEECQQLIQSICSETPDSMLYEDPSTTLPRVLEETFNYNNNKIIKTITYLYPYTNRRSGLIKNINYNVQEI